MTYAIEPTLKEALSNYDVIDEVSHGGFSRVLLVEERQNNPREKAPTTQRYAAKVFKKHSFFKLFLHELHMLQQASGTEHTQQLHEAIIDKEFLIIVTHYISGVTLKDHINKSQPLSQKDTWNLAIKLTQALACLHDVDLSHGDIKPSNILLSQSLEGTKVWLTDLGSAGQTHAETWQGDFSYSAPDVFNGNYSKKADSYSLGLTLIYCLTGHLPWTKQKVSDAAKIIAQCLLPAPIPNNLAPELHQLLSKLLDKNPERRWSIHQAAQFLANTAWLSDKDLPKATATKSCALTPNATYQDAAMAGIAYAQFRYATELESLGDITPAIHWYKKAAHLGFSRAMNNLGVLYEKQEANTSAVSWYTKAANKRTPHGCFNLALYYSGQNSEVSQKQITALYRRAAKNGHERALNRMGIEAERQQEHSVAFEYYLRAAYGGYAPAQFNVARYFGSNLGVSLWPYLNVRLALEKKDEMCLFWLEQAAQNGHKRSIALLKKFEEKEKPEATQSQAYSTQSTK